MDEIERSVVLPQDAKPLRAYGRNYAFDRGKVVATYLVPSSPPASDEGCAIMTADLGSRPCTKEEVAEHVALNARAAANETPADKRRWFRTPGELPFISDGGCEQVNVEFDTASHRVLSVACNGPA